jgi:hypothetical protein
MRSTRQDVNQETSKDQGRPVLDAESFQRLLAAAYILQAHPDRPPRQPRDAGHTVPFGAAANVQKRTPSLLIRESRIPASRSHTEPFTSPNVVPESAVRKQSPLHPRALIPLVGPMVRHAMNIFVSRPMFWRTFEALAIAMVFCALAGVSIHHISSRPGRTTHPAEMSEQRNASQPVTPAARVLALAEPPAATLKSRGATDGKADVGAEDIVIRYQKRAMDLHGSAMNKPTGGTVQTQLLPPENTTLKPGVRFTFGKDADMLAADTLIRYGVDSSASRLRNQKKAVLNTQAYK